MKRKFYSVLLGFFLLSTFILSPVDLNNEAQAAQNSILPMTFELLSSKPSDYDKQIDRKSVV